MTSVKVFLSDKKSKSFRGFFFISACDEASRPIEKKFHWSRRLIATNRIFAATNRIFAATNRIFAATNRIFAATNRNSAARLTTRFMERVSWHAACPHVRMAFNYITPCQKTEILAVRKFVIVVSLGNAELQNRVKDDALRHGAMMYLWRYE
jgi:hypothetical protein